MAIGSLPARRQPGVGSQVASARWRLGLIAAPLLASGCGSMMDVRPLATGRAEVAAYELTGSELAPLRREAQRLCPQGGEILRQAGRDQRPEAVDGRLRRWVNASSEWLTPPARNAQLVVLCRASPGSQLLLAASAVADPAARPVDEPPATAPLGPISVEW